MINLINKGTPIRPGTLNFGQFEQNNRNAVDAAIKTFIIPDSNYFKNPELLKKQLVDQYLIVPIVCERNNGKIDLRKILPDGEMHIIYNYPYTGSSLLFSVVSNDASFQTQRVKLEYKDIGNVGNLYLQLNVPFGPNMALEVNKIIELLFQFIARVQSMSSLVDNYNKNMNLWIENKINERIEFVKKINETANKIPDR